MPWGSGDCPLRSQFTRPHPLPSRLAFSRTPSAALKAPPNSRPAGDADQSFPPSSPSTASRSNSTPRSRRQIPSDLCGPGHLIPALPLVRAFQRPAHVQPAARIESAPNASNLTPHLSRALRRAGSYCACVVCNDLPVRDPDLPLGLPPSHSVAAIVLIAAAAILNSKPVILRALRIRSSCAVQ